MKIGKLEIKGYVALAPMAGVADRAMRELCIKHGAAFCVGELVSAKGITLGDRKSGELLEVHPDEGIKALQLFGSDPEVMARATEIAAKNNPSFIDINMGCPAPKVAGNGGGSALMKDPERCGKIVEACVKATDLPITVKIRAGWDKEHINAVEVAKICEQAGACAVTVHGRTKDQMYAPPVNLDVIKAVKDAVKIPVIGNGDIVDGKSAAEMLEKTGCDFLMVGRAAMGAPWVFSQINAYLGSEVVLPEPPLSKRMLILLEQIEMMMRYKNDRNALLEARKHTAWYMRGLRGAAELRRKCAEINSFDDVINLTKFALEAGKEQ